MSTTNDGPGTRAPAAQNPGGAKPRLVCVGAIAGAVFVCLTGCLKSREAYESIEWKLLFVIFGMLAFGAAMQHTGAAAFPCRSLLSSHSSAASRPSG